MARFRSSSAGDRRIAQQQLVAAAQVKAASEAASVEDKVATGISIQLGDDGTALGNKVKSIEQRLDDLEALP